MKVKLLYTNGKSKVLTIEDMSYLPRGEGENYEMTYGYFESYLICITYLSPMNKHPKT